MSKEATTYTFQDVKPAPDTFHSYTETLRSSKLPLIIDNGSNECRVGWATDDAPRLCFKNIVAKQRGKRDSEAQVGNEIKNIEVVRWLLKSPFDKNIVTQYDVQEQVFDYVFNHLGINTEGSVDHPVVLTEAVCNPSYCRQLMSELLFECYNVPSVVYGVDSLFSFYQNQKSCNENTNGLVIGCGYHATHVLPVLNGRLHTQHCRRINIGGCDISHYLMRLLQLKYPLHLSHVTLSRAEELMHKFCYVAVDYAAHLDEWSVPEYYDDHVCKVQLPVTPLPGYGLSADVLKEKRQGNVKKLKEFQARKREEKLSEEQEKLQQLENLKELINEGSEDQYNKALEDAGFSSPNEVQWTIDRISQNIERIKKRIQTDDFAEDGSKENGKRSRSESPTDGKMRKQENGADATKKIDERTLTEMRQKRQEIIEQRNKRRKRREEMAKRRTYASQQRMKIITQLADSRKVKDSNGKGGDTFGQNDDDWNVYKEITKDGGGSDTEEEDEKLGEIEAVLRNHDPDFQQQSAVSLRFDPNVDIAEYYQLHVGVEKFRVPELLFQPSMIAVEQGGIAETVEFILSQYTPEQQNLLAQNVFVTGGPASFPNIVQRMERELRMIRPFQSKFHVYRAGDPLLDSWLGARDWACGTDRLKCSGVTKAEHEEMGPGYLKEHCASNRQRLG